MLLLEQLGHRGREITRPDTDVAESWTTARTRWLCGCLSSHSGTSLSSSDAIVDGHGLAFRAERNTLPPGSTTMLPEESGGTLKGLNDGFAQIEQSIYLSRIDASAQET